MANELKFGNKVVFLNGLPITLPVASADPGSATAGDLYYNSVSLTVKYYNGSVWANLATGAAAANTSLNNLSSVAINTSLLPGVDNSINLGSTSFSWAGANIRSLKDASNINAINVYGRALQDTVATNQLSWTTAGVAFDQLTVSTVPFLNAAKVLTSSTVTPTELGYLSGVTSAIQTQLGAKISANGSIAFTANQPMGGFKLTGLAAGSAVGDSVRYEQAILANGTNAFTANQSMGSFNLTNVADPTAPQHAATKAYVDSVAQGLKPKTAVRASSLANVNISSMPASLDGVTLTSLDRILLKNQSLPQQNGIYIFNGAASAATRSTDMDALTPIDEINGAYTFIQSGTQAGQGWVVQSLVATLGTDPMVWVYFNDAASIVGGDMITVTGSTISVDLFTNGGLKSSNPGNSAGQLQISLEASSPSLAINGSNELGIATNGITNTHISGTAGIALSKLAALTTSRALQSNASTGFIEVSAVTNTELGYLSGVTSAIQTQLGGKANTSLNNLASTAVNADISLASDKAFNLGTASLRWNNLFVGTVDGGNAALALRTAASNASVTVNAHGTGTLDISATRFRRSVNGADTTNFIEDQYFDALTLAANTSSATEISSSLSFALASFDSAIIEYKIKEATSNKVRVGQFIVTTDGTIASSSDQFTESAIVGSAVGLSLTADISGGNVRILYNNTNASNAATMRCNIRRIRT